mgnify:CR=1 FL=1
MPIKPTPISTKRNLLSQAVTLAIATQLAAVPMLATAEHISPNPNAAGNTITVSVADASNETIFDNNGTIDLADSGELSNSGVLTNHSGGKLVLSSGTGSNQKLSNSGSIINGYGGEIALQGLMGRLDNTGTLTNQAGGQINIKNSPSGREATYNTLLNSAGGVIENQYGASINIESLFNYLENRGTLNNAGLITGNEAGYLDNRGTFNNLATGQLLLNSEEVRGSGAIVNAGVVELIFFSDGSLLKQTIDNSANLKLESLMLMGSVTNQASGQLVTMGKDQQKVRVLQGSIYNKGNWDHAAGNELQNDGLIQNETGGQLNLGGTLNNILTFNNAGTLSQIANSALNNSGTLTNQAGGDLTILAGGALNNSGTFTNRVGGIVKNHGVFDNTKDDRDILNEGLLTNYNGGKLSLTNATENHSKPQVFLNTGSIINKSGAEIFLEGSSNKLVNEGSITNQAGGLINIKDVPNALGPAYNRFHNESGGVIENQYGASILF